MEEKKTLRQRNNEAVKKYSDKTDSILMRLPMGTKKRIQNLGYTPTTFCKNIVLSELEKLEKLK